MCTLTGRHNKEKRENQEMKRTTLISASLLLAFAGCTCGQGWRPNFLTRFNNRLHGVSNVGAPCDAGCHDAHVATGGCDTCGTSGSANFGGYETVGDSYEVPNGVTYSTVPPNYGTPITPGGTSASSRMEPVSARPK
jgi:hypothetical protein